MQELFYTCNEWHDSINFRVGSLELNFLFDIDEYALILQEFLNPLKVLDLFKRIPNEVE